MVQRKTITAGPVSILGAVAAAGRHIARRRSSMDADGDVPVASDEDDDAVDEADLPPPGGLGREWSPGLLLCSSRGAQRRRNTRRSSFKTCVVVTTAECVVLHDSAVCNDSGVTGGTIQEFPSPIPPRLKMTLRCEVSSTHDSV